MLHVLLTNTFLVNRTGSELYIRDVAHALLKRGHTPIVYSPRLGELAEEIRRLGIPVTNDLDSLAVAPDLIHGQHHLETMTALARFPNTPAVYFCHGWQPWVETPPRHPRILHYVGVTERAQTRLAYEYAIPPDQINIVYNFVDLERFVPRAPLPSRPKRALLLSNHAHTLHPGNFSHIVRQACEAEGIHLDVVGLTNGNPTMTPETMLRDYDLVFGRGRVVLEAAAVGNAVICCDMEGAGPMVSMDNLDWLRRNNFGMFILDKRMTHKVMREQIARYNPDDAARVSSRVRAIASMEGTVDQIVEVYERALATWAERVSAQDFAEEQRALSRYFYWLSQAMPPQLVHQNEVLTQQVKRLTSEQTQWKKAREKLAKPLRNVYRSIVPLPIRLAIRDRLHGSR